MSLADLYRGDRAKPTETSSFTCPHYDAPPGEKRCRHYLKNGSCARPDEFMCVEFLKANGQVVPASTPAANESAKPIDSTPPAPKVATDLFGNPLPDPPRPAPAKPPTADKTTTPLRATEPTDADKPSIDVDQLRGFTTDDIASFKALGVEVCLQSETFGDLWLVPQYTGQPRKEITPEHAATVMRVLSVFHGSRVLSFEKATEAKS